jgi:hypothetical protein
MKLITLDRVIIASVFIIATTAAYFSVTGIGALFAGAFWSVVIMASAIELGKLVSVSFLYRYWNEAPKFLLRWMTPIAVALMIITSMGIYGYLSAAYAKVAAEPLIKNSQVSINLAQDSTLSNNIKYRVERLTQVMSLRAQQETRLDGAIAKTVTGTSRTVTNTQQTLRNSDAEIKLLQKEIAELNTRKDSLTTNRIKLQTDIQTNSSIGPFIYVANSLGVPLDTVVKWFILMIVFVFDPLSICLVIAYNFLKMRTPVDKLTKEVQKLGKHDFPPRWDFKKFEGPPATVTEAEINNLMTDVQTTTPSEPVEPNTFSAATPLENTAAQSDEVKQEWEPFYMDPTYDWTADPERWKNDQAAVNYYNYIKSFGTVPHVNTK